MIVGLKWKAAVEGAFMQKSISVYQYLLQIDKTGNYDMLIPLFIINVDRMGVHGLVHRQRKLKNFHVNNKFIYYYLNDLIDKKLSNQTNVILKTGWHLDFSD